MYVADVMRCNSTGRLRCQPAFGEVVAVTRPGPNKALEPRGQDHEGRRTAKYGPEPTLLDQQGPAPRCLLKEPNDMDQHSNNGCV
eukprot:12925700-Prorocentrum_lima.AAC.1